MKINPADFERLEALIKNTLARNPQAQACYKAKGLSHTRFMWDVWHVTVDLQQKSNVENYVWMRGLHDYLNDANIETALKRIIPE